MPKKSLYLFLFSLLFVASVSAQTKEPQKIIEFGYLECDDYLAKMEEVFIQADSNPASTVYVLVYEGRELKFNHRQKKIEAVLPTYGLAKAKIRSIRKILALRKISGDEVKFVEAGFREKLTVEFWLVPPGAAPPRPGPTLTKMKHRQGKSFGFCLDCCE